MEEIEISGRKRLLLLTRAEEIAVGDEAASELREAFGNAILYETDLSGDGPISLKEFVDKHRRQAGTRFGNFSSLFHVLPPGWGKPTELEYGMWAILNVSQRVVRAIKNSSDLPAGCEQLHWRLHIIKDSDTMNAFVLPNGHIYVFTGILGSCPSLDSLGFLLGHECAHAVLRHAGETMSEQPAFEMAALLATSVLATLLPLEGGFSFFQAAMLRLGLGAAQVPLTLVEKKFSRDHESEADQIGLLLASRACFDPYHAQYFFHQIAAAKHETGADVAEEQLSLLSTHPLDKQREGEMHKQLQLGMREYDQCGCDPVDRRKRRKLDKQLKRERMQSVRRLSCAERQAAEGTPDVVVAKAKRGRKDAPTTA